MDQKLVQFFQSIGPLAMASRASWADAFYKSIGLCFHFLRYRLNVFSPPLPKSDDQHFQGCGILWEKQLKKVISHLKTFLKGVKSPNKKQKNVQQIQALLIIIIKSILQGSGGYTTRIRRLYNKDQEVISRIFWVSVLLSALVKRCSVSHMRDLKKKNCI